MANRIVLAYSGGLDTSVILVWLKEHYQCEVIAFLADLGQDEDLDQAAKKARALGAADVVVENLQEEFVRDYVYPMLRANALYEGRYQLGTSIARPLIAKAQIDCARRLKGDGLCHGATGKGNDQIRFELSYAALAPDLEVIAPWRIWDKRGRQELLAYAEAHQIPVDKNAEDNRPPFSMDANLLHHSSEGNSLEDMTQAAPDHAFNLTQSPEQAPDEAETLTLTFDKGDCVALNDTRQSPAEMLRALNKIGGTHAIGRVDMIENRATGMKSRGVYETPGGTILLQAHRFMEELTLDGAAYRLKESLMPLYAELIYKGLWFAPEREMLQALINQSQLYVSGNVKIKLYKGTITPLARESAFSLYDEGQASFEENTHGETYDHKDAEGFIKLNSLRLKQLYKQISRQMYKQK